MRKPLEELQQEKADLEKRLAEKRLVLEDENASPSDIEAARKQIEQDERVLERVNEDMEHEEQKLPLRERVKNILKKYGWTLQAVALAVGIVLSALALAATNGRHESYWKWAQGYRAEAELPPARAHRLDSELYLQSCRLRSILPGGARLVAHPCRGGLLHGKAAQEEA